MTDGLVVDKSRVTRAQMRRITVMRIEVERAQKDLDAEKARELLLAADEIMASLVVAVPEGWLPKGVTLASKDWIGHVTQDQYDEIAAAVNAEPGKKTD